MLPPCMSTRRRSALRTTTRSTVGSLSRAGGASVAAWLSGNPSVCPTDQAQLSTRAAARVTRRIMLRFDTTQVGAIIGADRAPRHVCRSHTHGSDRTRISATTGSDALDARHHDLGAGPQVAEVEAGVVLLQQPLGHLPAALRECP